MWIGLWFGWVVCGGDEVVIVVGGGGDDVEGVVMVFDGGCEDVV